MLTFPLFRQFSAALTRLYAEFSGSVHPAAALTSNDEDDQLQLIADDRDEFVTIATFDKTTDAHIALGRLAAEGIHAMLFDDNMVQMDWLYAIALGGIKLRVQRIDAVAARRILATDYSADLDDVDVGKPES